jgi:hypothetical protein
MFSVEKAIIIAVTESYLQSVSTSRVEKIAIALGGKGISASLIYTKYIFPAYNMF